MILKISNFEGNSTENSCLFSKYKGLFLKYLISEFFCLVFVLAEFFIIRIESIISKTTYIIDLKNIQKSINTVLYRNARFFFGIIDSCQYTGKKMELIVSKILYIKG